MDPRNITFIDEISVRNIRGNTGSLVLNSTGTYIPPIHPNGLYITPINTGTTSTILYYDPSSTEITYDVGGGGSSLPPGTNYSDYLYWNPSGTGSWLVGDTRVHIGANAGLTLQQNSAIAIGNQAGSNTQLSSAIAIGYYAGNDYQGIDSVAIGNQAGQTNQSAVSIAIGNQAGQTGQNIASIAIGNQAGKDSQGIASIAIGNKAGQNIQVDYSIILNATGNTIDAASSGLFIAPITPGTNSNILYYDPITSEITYDVGVNPLPTGTNYSDYLYWDTNTFPASWQPGDTQVHIGANAGATGQGASAIAIGDQSGLTNQRGIAIGAGTAVTDQNATSIAIGNEAGAESQGMASIALGDGAAYSNQGPYASAIGTNAGANSQGQGALAIGSDVAYYNQGKYAIAIGYDTGHDYQGANSVAIGYQAGYNIQGYDSIAIGNGAGANAQSAYSIATGYSAGFTGQGTNSIAIGYSAGFTGQGTNSIAIGTVAGETNQLNNTIVINATGLALNTIYSDGTYISPIKSEATYASDANITYNISNFELVQTPLIKMIVYGSTTQTSTFTNDPLICDQILLSAGTTIDVSTGIWTCPLGGYYRVRGSFTASASTSSTFNLFWGQLSSPSWLILYNNFIPANSTTLTCSNVEFVIQLYSGSSYSFIMESTSTFSIDLQQSMSQWEIEFICRN